MHLKLQIKSAAQTTQKGNVQMAAGDSKIVDIDKLEKNLDLLDGDSDALAKSIAESKDIDTVLEQVHKGKALRAFQSLYINSLLSSHWTQAVNLLMNFYQYSHRYFELYLRSILLYFDWREVLCLIMIKHL